MESCKTKRIISVFVVLLSLFARACRGGRNSFSGEKSSDPMIRGVVEQENELGHSYTDQGVAESDILDSNIFDEPLDQTDNMLNMQNSDANLVPDFLVPSYEYEPVEDLQRIDDQYTPAPSTSKHSSNKAYDIPGTSNNEKMVTSRREGPDFDPSYVDKTAPSYGLLADIDDANEMEQYSLSKKEIADLERYNERLKSEENNSTGLHRGEKRTASAMSNPMNKLREDKRRREEYVLYETTDMYPQEEYVLYETTDIYPQEEYVLYETDDIYLQGEIEGLIEDGAQPSLPQQPSNTARNIALKTEIKYLNVSLWNSMRLKNAGRHRNKLSYKTLCEYTYSEDDLIGAVKDESYQAELKAEISTFSQLIAPQIKENALWYLIASKDIDPRIKRKDIFGLKRLFEEEKNSVYIEMIKKLDGYYDGIFDDMIAYMEENMPQSIDACHPPTRWKKTLGDIYMSECLGMNYAMAEKQKRICKINKKYHKLAYAMHMIVMLPEVYKDFSRMSEEFIRNTCTKNSDNIYEDRKKHLVLSSIQTLVHLHNEEKIDMSVYNQLYTALGTIYSKETVRNALVTELYRNIYIMLADFYKKAEIVDKKSEHVLAGKGVITNQKYMKCEMAVNIATRNPAKRVEKLETPIVENKWSVAPSVNAHYHVYYVDNKMGQPRRLCMPMYTEPETKKKYYLHRVSDMVAYIKTLYGIEDSSDVIHPFKVGKQSKQWSYIKEEGERNKTVEELEGHELVFYHIRHSLEEKFTFAEFSPLEPHGVSVIPIPLFLTSLMEKGVKLTPFTKQGEHKKLESMDFHGKEPNSYAYSDAYKDTMYSDMHKYYSNLYILPEKVKSTECYAMDCQISKRRKSTVRAIWYVKVPGDVDEYTHCIPSNIFEDAKHSEDFDAFVATIESRSYNEDSSLQGFWLCRSTTKTTKSERMVPKIQTLLEDQKTLGAHKENNSIAYLKGEISKIEEKLKKTRHDIKTLEESKTAQKERLQAMRIAWGKINIEERALERFKEALSIRLAKTPKHANTDIIVFRNANLNRSNLGAHNEILDVFITFYRR
ncbi:hypothetical protein NEMIN01_2407 [Nematocida minor]|uniref:uncharacterized protein n=1 Tax=Nematocida minor TaxID=1912983 RepID=UPI00221ECD48|nr:uncharacterized protein NEMIN01_2407 [Nematocida minor]KAI5193200.1 hypothetical protein NEMIN01_2407 [Nematocida minor]